MHKMETRNSGRFFTVTCSFLSRRKLTCITPSHAISLIDFIVLSSSRSTFPLPRRTSKQAKFIPRHHLAMKYGLPSLAPRFLSFHVGRVSIRFDFDNARRALFTRFGCDVVARAQPERTNENPGNSFECSLSIFVSSNSVHFFLAQQQNGAAHTFLSSSVCCACNPFARVQLSIKSV